MAVTFVGASSQCERSMDDTLTVSRPSGVLAKDVMLAFVINYNKRPTAPGGWNFIRQGQDSTTNFSVWYKVAGTSEPNSYTWDAGTAYGDITWGCAIVAYRGVDTEDIINQEGGNSSTTAETLNVDTSFETTENCMLVYASGNQVNASDPAECSTNKEAHSERIDDGAANTDQSFARSVAVYDTTDQVPAGEYEDFQVTRTGTTVSHTTLMIALKARSFPENEGTGTDVNSLLPDFPVSKRFYEALKGSHTVYSYVDVKSPTNQIIRLAAVGGSVDVDRTAEVRRRCSLTAIDPTGELTPAEAGDILSPYGTEIYPYRGILYPDGTTEAIPLGIFRISKVSISDESDGLSIGIEAFDRSRTISRDKFTEPYIIEAYTNIMDALKQIARRTFNELAFNTVSSPRIIETTRVYDVGDDPWEAITELATSLGCDVFFDVQGRLTVVPPPNIDALPSPQFTYIEGENCTLLSLEKILTDDPGYNGVVVIGESPGDELPPVRGIAWDDEPTSATYRLGPYGEVPMFHQDQLVKTEQEANDLAAMLLQNQLGFSSQLSISAIANPLLECGDVIQVRRSKAKVDDLYVVDAFGVPMNANGSQDLTLRQKRTVG